jgi:hypothetical protein
MVQKQESIMHLRSFCLLIAVIVQLFPPSNALSQAYHREDRQYYKNMLPDIRNTRNHVSWYRGDPVEYTDPEESTEDNH